ncbi:hypothetical protein ABT075_01595 [Streptomyces sp. NPDC002677]|uniref:hypothetical protein n=1 Tax=Streptomyces sp. NPDC002677 TaxID=3154774 RepID=UPI00331B1335
MSLFRDDGIVLRTQKPGEADRITLRPCGGHGIRPRPRRGSRPQPPGAGAR